MANVRIIYDPTGLIDDPSFGLWKNYYPHPSSTPKPLLRKAAQCVVCYSGWVRYSNLFSL